MSKITEKVVVRDNIQDLVFNSTKNVLLEFYAPSCGHCKKLAPILDEVVSFENDPDVVIAKFLSISFMPSLSGFLKAGCLNQCSTDHAFLICHSCLPA
ncbi:hypothetical protein AgCh_028748 [Apium graveolens]